MQLQQAILKTSRGTSRLQCGIIFSGDVILINTAALHPSLRSVYKNIRINVYSFHPPAAQANCCDIKSKRAKLKLTRLYSQTKEAN